MLKLDALFNFLGVLIFFIVALLAQVNPPTDPIIDPPGNLVASIAWPAGSIDVDLWVKSPGDEAVGYSRKSGKVWSLLRDDLGTANDLSGMNFESAFTRGLPDGEYIVNVRCYGCAGKLPVPVATEVRLADGTLVWFGVVTLVSDKQEKTALRFVMRAGKVVPGSASHVFREIRGV
ncbi:hypothetical protein [Shinella sp. DD12]|uniref:hypothetical protein n=1 Tax=Shinella sp. DD12 TaxID=1410620 RepID=UPI000409EEA3|nr:hypothetical protein [Shinella sp. DD12]EYR81904.1 hypothetical protein SHLA_4c001960 [Shinella sp. DD12]